MKKYDQVIERILTLVAQDAITDGHKIPSIRDMSRQMNVSTMTVLKAYHQLEARGVIESNPRSGYVLRPKSIRSHDTRISLPEARQADIEIRTKAVSLPLIVEELIQLLSSPGKKIWVPKDMILKVFQVTN